MILTNKETQLSVIAESVTEQGIRDALDVLYYDDPLKTWYEKLIQTIFSKRELLEFFEIFKPELERIFKEEEYEECNPDTVFGFRRSPVYIDLTVPGLGVFVDLPNIKRYVFK